MIPLLSVAALVASPVTHDEAVYIIIGLGSCYVVLVVIAIALCKIAGKM